LPEQAPQSAHCSSEQCGAFFIPNLTNNSTYDTIKKDAKLMTAKQKKEVFHAEDQKSFV